MTATVEVPAYVIPVATDVTFRIRRFNPEVDEEPHWEDFTLALYPTDRVLTALDRLKGEQDGTLTFRRSCGHGICGSDAMRINGRNRLACKTLVKDLDIRKPITVEAIQGLPLEKDLVVNMEPFFAAFRAVLPFLIPAAGHAPSRERLQSAVWVRGRRRSTASQGTRGCRRNHPRDPTPTPSSRRTARPDRTPDHG
jgi:succinate dehydrogenase / fumarate reductase iron-sulfur subunit